MLTRSKSLLKLSIILVFSLAIVNIVSAQLNSLRVSTTNKATTISQYGITWTFSEVVELGKYLNGDYWVIGPVTIIRITPSSEYDSITGGYRNGSMVNPPGGVSSHGFDSRGGFGYIHSLNVGHDISSESPLELYPGDSLVSSAGRDTMESSNRRWILHHAILTVVSEAPANGSFRPPYVDASKMMNYTWNDVNTVLLEELVPVSGIPSWDEAEGRILPPLVMIGRDYWSTQLLATGTDYELPGYGREITRDIAAAVLMINTSASLSLKKQTIVGLIQRGIDDWGIYSTAIANGRGFPWNPDGGIFAGRKLPIILAGALLSDNNMSDYGVTQVSLNHEDAQIFYVGDQEINRNYEDYTWDSRNIDNGEIQVYTESLRNMPEWGIRHTTVPTADNADWRVKYRELNGVASPEYFFAALVMGLQSQWNHDASFDYSHRYMSIMAGDGDPFGYIVNGQPVVANDSLRGNWDNNWAGAGTWITAMYDTYWGTYYSGP